MSLVDMAAWEKENGYPEQHPIDYKPNPKDAIGQRKPPLHLIPAAANILESKALEFGARRHGPWNWRNNNPMASVYVSALKRHVDAWFDGEENASDSGIHHLAHARACLSILLDVITLDLLHDDRPPPGKAAELIARFTAEPDDEIGDLIEVDDEPELVPAMGVSQVIFEGRDMPADPDRYARGSEAPHAFVEQQPRFGETRPAATVHELPPVAKPVLGPTEKQRIRTELMDIFEQFDNGCDGDGIQHIKMLAEQLK